MEEARCLLAVISYSCYIEFVNGVKLIAMSAIIFSPRFIKRSWTGPWIHVAYYTDKLHLISFIIRDAVST